MNNYYDTIGLSAQASTKEIESAIAKKLTELKKYKIPSSSKNKIKKELHHIHSVLTDYHKRREYDDFFHHFPSLFTFKRGPNLLSHLTTQTQTPYPHTMTTQTPYPHTMTTLPPLHQNFHSYNQSYTMEQNRNNDETIIYSHKYENRNGHENEHNERIVIDHDGNERRHLLPNRYLHH